MNTFLHIVRSTPFYAWIILAYLLFVGIRNLKTRTVHLPKLFIIPLILPAIKYKTFLAQDSIIFILIIIFGTAISFFIHTVSKTQIIKDTKTVVLPGSYATLLILMAFFAVKYYFGYLQATAPDLTLKYSLIENIITGLFAGYFIGRAICYTYKYFKA